MRSSAETDAEGADCSAATTRIGSPNPGSTTVYWPDRAGDDRPIQRSLRPRNHAERRIIGSHADGKQTITGGKLAYATSQHEPRCAEHIPGKSNARHNHVVVVMNQRPILKLRRCHDGTNGRAAAAICALCQYNAT